VIVDVRDVPVHFSALKLIALSPAHYKHAATAPWERGTLARRMGTTVHAAVFEPHRLVVFEAGEWTDAKGKTKPHTNVRQGGAFEAFKARQAPDAIIVNAKEMAHATAMARALREHPIAGPILFGPDVIHEREILWSRDGRVCSSRPDARIPGRMIADLKTCRTAQPERFVREALWSYYHAQLRFYDEADAYDTGRAFTPNRSAIDLYSVAIESKPPYVVQVYQLDDTAIVAADRTIGGWWSRLMACEAEDAWHGYRQCVEPITCDDPENFLPGAAIDDTSDEDDNRADTGDDWTSAA
jgi:hypothetical protein